jgi:hypothetical protein
MKRFMGPRLCLRRGEAGGMTPDELEQPPHEKAIRYGRLQRVMRNPFMMIKFNQRMKESGAAGYILLWLLGIPIPVLFVIFLLRGCT